MQLETEMELLLIMTLTEQMSAPVHLNQDQSKPLSTTEDNVHLWTSAAEEWRDKRGRGRSAGEINTEELSFPSVLFQ